MKNALAAVTFAVMLAGPIGALACEGAYCEDRPDATTTRGIKNRQPKLHEPAAKKPANKIAGGKTRGLRDKDAKKACATDYCEQQSDGATRGVKKSANEAKTNAAETMRGLKNKEAQRDCEERCR